MAAASSATRTRWTDPASARPRPATLRRLAADMATLEAARRISKPPDPLLAAAPGRELPARGCAPSGSQLSARTRRVDRYPEELVRGGYLDCRTIEWLICASRRGTKDFITHPFVCGCLCSDRRARAFCSAAAQGCSIPSFPAPAAHQTVHRRRSPAGPAAQAHWRSDPLLERPWGQPGLTIKHHRRRQRLFDDHDQIDTPPPLAGAIGNAVATASVSTALPRSTSRIARWSDTPRFVATTHQALRFRHRLAREWLGRSLRRRRQRVG